MKTLLFILTLAISSLSSNIVTSSTGGSRTILETKDYYREVSAFHKSDSFSVNLHCRLFRYCPPKKNIPLVVFFISWGGTITGAESVVQYENITSDPFLSLVIMPERNGNDYNTSNWYWGNVYETPDGKRSIPWAHNGVINLLNDIKKGGLDSILMGCTIDTNRIYGTGTSIGGTATVQICARHPEIFAAFHSHVGWTRFWGGTNSFFSDTRGCLAFADLIGGIRSTANNLVSCNVDTAIMIRGNTDQLYLSQNDKLYQAWRYTDLNWYFGKTGESWNYRDPSFPTPFAIHTTGSKDDPENQGDNLIPSLDISRRGFIYHRVDAGHAGGGFYVRWNWMRNFRKNQSFLAFTNRSYDDFGNFDGNTYGGHGKLNDLEKHGWDPESIIDQNNYYKVNLTGTGRADVTLHRLQNLVHSSGTTYSLYLADTLKGTVIADEFGLLTIPGIQNPVKLELRGAITKSIDKKKQQPPQSSIEIKSERNSARYTITGHTDQNLLSQSEILVFNMNGRQIAKLHPEKQQIEANTTHYTFLWDTQNIPNGVYALQMGTVNSYTILTKLHPN